MKGQTVLLGYPENEGLSDQYLLRDGQQSNSGTVSFLNDPCSIGDQVPVRR
jgi:hypothetical protein